MKKIALALLCLFAAKFAPLQAQVTGWSYTTDFPWIYLQDESSWGYFFESNGQYFIFVQNSGEYINAGEVVGNSPLSIANQTFTFDVEDNGQFGVLTLRFFSNGTLSGEFRIGSSTSALTGQYIFTKQGANLGALQVEFVEGQNVEEGLFFLEFGGDNTGSYMAAFAPDGQPLGVGDDGLFGSFQIAQ
ncbi:hypothetical protein [Rubellicoccus peritrichatus]|uniref:Uncharacterized protein n=1 Tax=Rubellicoccus peritrichatus TaxID=3080537 RepID=A0AAQ3LAQ8_9BACT|nr:hypothetical protein [Puniceicoccus sp. CR14]WOO41802.1 hypothetical protein RZN69_01785 [Puniceicoccus sp. CR14]